jgi:prephenate dehydratase
VDLGIVPFENSTNGAVVFTLDLFADRSHEVPDIRVCGEAFVLVRHYLVGRLYRTEKQGDGETDENEQLKEIKILYSHPQVWTQCNAFLTKHLAHTERIDTSSTSKAAELVASDTSNTSAAISSSTAANVFGLDILAEGIEEMKGNATRFLVIYKHPPSSSGLTSSTIPPHLLPPANDTGHTHKTLLYFTVSHADPGALARALAVFGSHNVNLTFINARPSLERPWHYLFFVEFWGLWYPGLEEGSVAMALRDLEGVVERWKWCGCWKAVEG